MANYKTHKKIGMISTALVIPAVYIIDKPFGFFNINIESIILFFIVGVVGSLFPDIDLKQSRPTKILKTILITFLTILYALNLNTMNSFLSEHIPKMNDYILYASMVIIPFIASMIILGVIQALTYHRGIIHSIPFAVLSSLILSIIISAIQLDKVVFDSLFIGFGFFWGFLTHLALDEMYSVDFRNRRMKKSFGTAISFFSMRNPIGYIAMYGAIAFLTQQLFLS